MSVDTPKVVPLITTVTPGKTAPLLSFTTPFSTFGPAGTSPFARIRMISLYSSYSKFTFFNTISNTSLNSLSLTWTETWPASRTTPELYIIFIPVCCFTASTNFSTETSFKSKVTSLLWEKTWADKFRLKTKMKTIQHLINIKFFLNLFKRPGNRIRRFFFIPL